MYHQRAPPPVVCYDVRRQSASQASVGFDKLPEWNGAVVGSFVGRWAVYFWATATKREMVDKCTSGRFCNVPNTLTTSVGNKRPTRG